ncbi:MAG: Spy/CpxP family protein refolding chaperone [Desulfobacteraceae bacterium]|nr:Spy/CpxP family protein refolding chaperone [Desulfobacteraceae bacterium]
MKKTAIVGLCGILALSLAATVALAWGPGFGPWFGRGFGGPANGVPPIPDLTAEQSDQIQALRDGFLEQIEPLREDLFTKGTELRTLWSSPNPDATAVTAKQKEILDLQSTLQEKATTLGLEIRKVLTPEQLAQLPAFSQASGYGPGAGFGPRGFGPPMMGMRGPFGRW